jgi:uncharacterized UPF0160 family protein
MAESVMWIVPEAPAPQTQQSKWREMVSGAGLRFGVLDNSKSNADQLLAMIVDGVRERFPEAKIVRARKPSAAIGASAEVLAELEREADVVIAAMAD